MTLSNKRTSYSVEETGQNMVLKGELVIDSQNNSLNFYGSFEGTEQAFLGNFSYNESENGLTDKNLGALPKVFRVEAEALLDKTINAINTELINDNK